MMKNRGKKIISTLFALLAVLFLLSSVCSAEEYTFEGKSSPLGELYEGLPPELRDELGELSLEDPSEVAEELTEKLSAAYWVEKIGDGVKAALLPTLGTVSSIMGMLLLTASLRLLSENITLSSFGDVFNMCSDVCMAAVVLRCAEGMIETASAYLDRLCSIMNVMIPVTEAICLTEASLTKLAVHRSAMLLYIGITSNLNNLVLKPLFGVLFGFAVVSSVMGDMGLGGFIGGIRKFVMIVISLFTMLFSFVLGLQTVLARSADSLGLKTIRLALGSFIPIVGGTLSEALTTVREGFGVIRSAAGVGGVVIILLLVLPTTLSLLLNSAALSFCHMTAEILGCGRSGAVIGEIKSVLSVLLAVVLATSLLFVMAMILFAKVGGG